jgi:hypothetical protein
MSIWTKIVTFLSEVRQPATRDAALLEMALMAEPTVTVPISSTNVVASQIFTQLVGWLQAAAVGVGGYLLANPSVTASWPAWAAFAASAGLAYLKGAYLQGSNQGTITLVNALQQTLAAQAIKGAAAQVPAASLPTSIAGA